MLLSAQPRQWVMRQYWLALRPRLVMAWFWPQAGMVRWAK